MAKRWYSVSVLSNFEKKVAEQIRTSVEESGLQDEIEEILVPTEDVIEVRRGKKVTSERRFMPGYVLVRMEMSDRGYHMINSINRVTGFLGPQGRQDGGEEAASAVCIGGARCDSEQGGTEGQGRPAAAYASGVSSTRGAGVFVLLPCCMLC